MWLDGFDNLDGDEGGAEGGTEQQSEAARAKAAKSLAGIKRIQKDEWKAKRDNDHLHECLREIITSRKYDAIIPHIFPLFDSGTPSHIVIGAFSLVHQKASDIIRDHYMKEWEVQTHREFRFPAYSTTIEFDDETIDPTIRKRINEWIEDIFAIISYDPSVVMTERFLYILTTKEKKNTSILLAKILIFFLGSLNLHISEEKAMLYTEFILKEVERKLKELKLEKI